MLAFALRRRLEPAEVRAVVVMVVALIMLSIGLHAPAGSRFTGWVLATWLFVQVVIAAGLAARRGALITSAAAGLLYGAADLSLKAVTRAGSLEAVVGSPWLWTALGATVAAFFAFQHALQRDRPLAVIAIMTAATNVTSIAGALVVFQEPLGHSPALQLLHAAAFALVVLAAWRLAPVNARLTDAPASG
jgi:hypothetical protein